jgi:hypothetical protein
LVWFVICGMSMVNGVGDFAGKQLGFGAYIWLFGPEL